MKMRHSNPIGAPSLFDVSRELGEPVEKKRVPKVEKATKLARPMIRFYLSPAEAYELDHFLFNLFDRLPATGIANIDYPNARRPLPEVFPQTDTARYRASVSRGIETNTRSDYVRYQALSRAPDRKGLEHFAAEQNIRKMDLHVAQLYWPSSQMMAGFDHDAERDELIDYPITTAGERRNTSLLDEQKGKLEEEYMLMLFKTTIMSIYNADWSIWKEIEKKRQPEIYTPLRESSTRYLTLPAHRNTRLEDHRAPGSPPKTFPKKRKKISHKKTV
jgi:hypothetical protein